jgi:hypothetical protein
LGLALSGDRAMLRAVSKEVAECRRRAVECAERAKKAANPDDRAFYSDMEQRWLFMARNYEFTDSLSHLTSELGRRKG